MREQIISQLMLVSSNSIWGISIQTFLEKKEDKTLDQCYELVDQLQQQMRDNPATMMKILGKAFGFIRDVKIPEPLKCVDESLNIEKHYERLTIIALNKHKKDDDAADALGISKRTLVRWKQRFFIRKDADGSYYQLSPVQQNIYKERMRSKIAKPLIQ